MNRMIIVVAIFLSGCVPEQECQEQCYETVKEILEEDGWRIVPDGVKKYCASRCHYNLPKGE